MSSSKFIQQLFLKSLPHARRYSWRSGCVDEKNSRARGESCGETGVFVAQTGELNSKCAVLQEQDSGDLEVGYTAGSFRLGARGVTSREVRLGA